MNSKTNSSVPLPNPDELSSEFPLLCSTEAECSKWRANEQIKTSFSFNEPESLHVMYELCCLTHLLLSAIHVLVFSARAFSLWYCSSAITSSFCRRLFISDGIFKRAPFTCRCFQIPVLFLFRVTHQSALLPSVCYSLLTATLLAYNKLKHHNIPLFISLSHTQAFSIYTTFRGCYKTSTPTFFYFLDIM